MRTDPNYRANTELEDEYFERKARDLVVAEDEIEAWELDSQELDGFGSGRRFSLD
jgi:hypothetical protein